MTNELGPYERNKIYCGKSEKLMAKLPDDCIDMTCTSPPYDNLRLYNGFTLDWHEIIRQLYRTTKPGGVVVWVVADATIDGSETGTSFKQALWAMGFGIAQHDKQADTAVMEILQLDVSNEEKTALIHAYYFMRQEKSMFEECGFNCETMIYKQKGTGAKGSNYYYWQSFEFMFVWAKGQPKTSNLLKDKKNLQVGKLNGQENKVSKMGTRKERGKRITQEYSTRDNVWEYQVGNNGDDKTAHEAPFPEALAQDHILTWSNAGDLVFDCFVGSGTVPKMCYRNGRDYLGFDSDPAACDMAEKRVRQAQPPLLVIG